VGLQNFNFPNANDLKNSITQSKSFVNEAK